MTTATIGPRPWSVGVSLAVLIVAIFVFLSAGEGQSFGPLDLDAADRLALDHRVDAEPVPDQRAEEGEAALRRHLHDVGRDIAHPPPAAQARCVPLLEGERIAQIGQLEALGVDHLPGVHDRPSRCGGSPYPGRR